MSRQPPYPPPALLFLHGNTCHRPRFWCRRFLSVKGRRMALGLLSPPLVPLFGAPTRDPSKNREMGRALALRGCGSIMITNNQLIVGGSDRGDVWVEARGWESGWRDTVPSFGTTIQMMKKYIYEIHRCLWMAPDRQRLTQQPTKNRRPQQREL